KLNVPKKHAEKKACNDHHDNQAGKERKNSQRGKTRLPVRIKVLIVFWWIVFHGCSLSVGLASA
ncbi:MAG: hypothetical protein KAT44_00275, partial [Pirellulales bacterium]|nr:hypothetical protein [Pirellulales bacterium]